MATIRRRQPLTDYDLVTRSQAEIGCIQHFKSGRLSRYLEALSFNNMGYGLAEKNFNKSQDLAIYNHAARLYRALLIIAPILQRQPLSVRFDWQPGHVLSHFRIFTKGNIKRFNFGVRCIERSYQPELLIANLDRMGIHDQDYIEELVELYDRYNLGSGRTLQHKLADLIFDPVMLYDIRNGFELRNGNIMYRLEKQPFDGSVDIRKNWVTLQQYSIRSFDNSKGGRHLEILLSDEYLEAVRTRFKDALSSHMSAHNKVRYLFRIVFDVVHVARWARSADSQMIELRRVLTRGVSSLAGTTPAVLRIPNRLYTLWLEQLDTRLLIKVPNFFLYPDRVEKEVYMNFFNPFRGGAL